MIVEADVEARARLAGNEMTTGLPMSIEVNSSSKVEPRCLGRAERPSARS